MPETRYNEIYKDGVLISQEPYEVSDEQLAEETEQTTCEEYLKHSSDVITQPEIWYLLRVFGKKLGYTIGED